VKPVDLATIARWSGGSLLRGVPSAKVASISTDTRKPVPGSLFVALSGESFDAHDFLEAAGESGVAAMLVSRLTKYTEDCEAAIIHVGDTLTALQELARNYRQSLSDLRVVGVTGSNGKTSTKDFIREVLGGSEQVSATLGNFNNHIGLPLTILSTGPDQKRAVWEMGMSNPGEIERLAEIAAADVAVITHIGTAHIEFMKTREAIALEKGMLVEAIDGDGVVILNANDDCSQGLAERSRGRVVRAGIESGEVRAEGLVSSAEGTDFDLVTNDGKASVRLPVAGRHMVGNAILAAAVGLEFGCSLKDIAARLSGAILTGGRLQRREVAGLNFLDDSYNANPDSMRAALRTLIDIATTGRRIAVLGRMAELGDCEESEHLQLGATVAGLAIDVLIGVGDAGQWIVDGARREGREALVIEHFEDQKGAAEYIKAEAATDDLILVKGSRSASMEAVIRELKV